MDHFAFTGGHSGGRPCFWGQVLNSRASLVSQTVKNLPPMQETQVQSLGWEDPLEKELATHSNILAWRIPWTEEPGRLEFMGSLWWDLKESDTTNWMTSFLFSLSYRAKVCILPLSPTGWLTWSEYVTSLCFRFPIYKKEYDKGSVCLKGLWSPKSMEQGLAGISLNSAHLGLPWWLSGEESAYQFRKHGFNPWSGKVSHASGQLSLCPGTRSCIYWAHVLQLKPTLSRASAPKQERPP